MTLLCYIIVFSVKAKCTSLLNLCCDINIILLFYKQFDSFQTTKSPIYYLLLCSFSIFIATTTIYQIRKRFLSKSNFVINLYLIHFSLIRSLFCFHLLVRIFQFHGLMCSIVFQHRLQYLYKHLQFCIFIVNLSVSM